MKRLLLCFLLTSIFLLSTKLLAQNNSIGGVFNQSWSKITYNVDKQPVFDISNIKTVIISEVVNKQNIVDTHSIDIYDELSCKEL